MSCSQEADQRWVRMNVAAGTYRIDVRKDASTVSEGGTYIILRSQACGWEGL